MPWGLTWYDAPKNMSLEVHKELPYWAHERSLSWGVKEAEGWPDEDTWVFFHYCRHCGGWIEGHAQEFKENTMDSTRLAGRSGVAYHCLRCGQEIGFSGAVS